MAVVPGAAGGGGGGGGGGGYVWFLAAWVAVEVGVQVVAARRRGQARASGAPATYEELLALGDALGHVAAGLSDAQIAALPARTAGAADVDRACAVCLEALRAGEQVTVLPCEEVFHTECIATWLRTQATCPLCRSRIG